MFNKIDLEYNGAVIDPKASPLITGLSVVALLCFLILMLLNHEVHYGGVQPFIDDNINLSGVTNAVTAVLLNFRAYDTLLELAVLLIAVIAVLPSHDHQLPAVQRTVESEHNLVILALQRWISPALLIFSGYLLWAGASQPGGAFQAGALLAGACVLMFQTGTYRINYTSIIARYLLVVGLVVFVVVALALIWFEGNLLNYPLNYAGLFILLIEGCATVSIAIALASLYSSLIEPCFYELANTHRKAP
ncbi:MAG: multisubunit Na+/H+ antiporter MnhB subunit [Psychromonas sp.]|jgi:multisubunit Na+/H+ antiporter MnhB subunit|uniref:hydrogen gas-evolving membrane-bound hydrogenase subunit E n=1 Tax=Psychromonas sp. TaxID=1884585 RepID=UPI0039E5907C